MKKNKDNLPEHWKEEVDYIFGWYPFLLTTEEKKAYRHLMVLQKIDSTQNKGLKNMMVHGFLNREPKVHELLKEGEEKFFERTMRRVYFERFEELNLCPNCGSLCRTPRACLCPRCNHSWFEKRDETMQE